MNLRDAVAYLAAKGYPCSPGTARALVKSGQLRCFRPGVTGKGPMTFTEAQLDRFLAAAEGRPAGEAPRAPAPRAPRPAPAPRVSRGDDWRGDLAKVIKA